MTRCDEAMAVMQRVLLEQHQAGEVDRQKVANAIDAAYPFSERAYHPYKAWLAVRKEFFARHNLPLKGSRQNKHQAVLI